MPNSDQPPGSKPNQDQTSLQETIRQSNQAIEESRAQIARSRALSQSEADLARAIDQISEEEAAASHGCGK